MSKAKPEGESMANELIRVVTTCRVKSLGEGPDWDQISNDMGEYLVGTVMKNADLVLFDDEFLAQTHVHVSTQQSNCDHCIAHGMDEKR
jgi:hypothetical protein